jgi:hypothetical protein
MGITRPRLAREPDEIVRELLTVGVRRAEALGVRRAAQTAARSA